MMVWKLAIRPITARKASVFAAPLPYSTRKPSSSGSPDVDSVKAPCMPSALPMLEFRKVISSAEIISVSIPEIRPLGMSFFGSADSSAASGSCSMARNSQTANGSVASTPFQPNGNQEPPPFSSSTLAPSAPTPTLSAQRSKSTCGIALTQNTARMSSAATVTMTDTRKESSTPNKLRSRNTTYEAAHQTGCISGGVSNIDPRYEPMKNTITAGVRMYSMLSASPVNMPPQGPIALRAKEYAAPVCG